MRSPVKARIIGVSPLMYAASSMDDVFGITRAHLGSESGRVLTLIPDFMEGGSFPLLTTITFSLRAGLISVQS